MHKYLIASAFSVAIATQTSVAWAADSGRWAEGRDYQVIKPAQPVNVAPGKAEIIEVFSYGCIACYQFYPSMDKLKTALPKNAEMSYIHASFNPAESWPMFQRAYITAQALGIAEKTHTAMFKAIWESDELAVVDRRSNRLKKPQPTIEQVAAFYERTAGVKKEEFLKMSKSFSIEVKIRSSDAAIMAYRANSTPTLVINGKYSFNPPSNANEMIELVNYLIAKDGPPRAK